MSDVRQTRCSWTDFLVIYRKKMDACIESCSFTAHCYLHFLPTPFRRKRWIFGSFTPTVLNKTFLNRKGFFILYCNFSDRNVTKLLRY